MKKWASEMNRLNGRIKWSYCKIDGYGEKSYAEIRYGKINIIVDLYIVANIE